MPEASGNRQQGLEVRREMGISEQTLYNWKRKYGG
jgi:transposase-like protein